MKKIPFVYNHGEDSAGIDLNVIGKVTERDSTGVSINGIFNWVRRDSRGVDITGIIKNVDEDSKGVDLTGLLKGVQGDFTGLQITGLYNEVQSNSKGVSIAGLVNYSEGVNDFLIQYGTMGNYVKEKSDGTFGLQIGLYNKVGKQTSPLINFWGIKNIPKLLKKAISKKSEE